MDWAIYALAIPLAWLLEHIGGLIADIFSFKGIVIIWLWCISSELLSIGRKLDRNSEKNACKADSEYR